MVKALLFDLDGTLVDSYSLWLEANLQALQAWDFRMDEQTFVQEIYLEGLHYHGILEKCGLSTERSAQFYRERDDLYEALLRKKAQWIGSAEMTLKQCATKLPLGLMTGSASSYIAALDTRLHLSKIFSALVTYDDTGLKMKPNPYGLFLLAEKLGVDPFNCTYVGNEHEDIEAAHAAGMKSFLLSTKDTPENAVDAADVVLQQIEDILEYVIPSEG